MNRILLVACAATLASAACGGAGTGESGSGGGHAASSSAGAGGAAASSNASSSGAGIGGNFAGSGGGNGMMTPVRAIPNLSSITFYERTGGNAPTPYEFTVNGPELTVKAADPLTLQTADIVGASTEYYDVYYSNLDGTFNLDGSYLTISGSFLQTLPAGGGLNLAEISLNYTGKPAEFGNYVASYVSLGDNMVPASVPNCIDGNLQTHTTMGNTVGAPPDQRLRLTLGFLSSSGVPK